MSALMYPFKSYIHKESMFFVAEVPGEIIDQLGRSRHIPVRGKADGVHFQSTCMPRKGNRHVIFLNADLRRKIGKTNGDQVSIELEYDPVSREVPIPEDVEMILAEDEAVLHEFLNGSPSDRRQFIIYILQAKHEETRLKRIRVLAERLRGKIARRERRAT